MKQNITYVVLQDGDYVDESTWCPNCNKDTRQVIHSDGHERDSSYDTQQCLNCGKTGWGMDGFKEYR